MKILMMMGLLLAAPSLWAQEYVSTSKTNAGYLQSFNKSWMVMLDYQRASVVTTHSETSSASEFESLGESIEVPKNRIGLLLLKEFQHKNLLSFTAQLGGGILQGSDSATLEGSEFSDYEQVLDGAYAGVGLSANLNYYVWRMKVQPYFGVEWVFEDADYDLTYAKGAAVQNLRYEHNGQIGNINLGLRFLDSHVGLMSHITLGYTLTDAGSVTANTLINDAEMPVEGADFNPNGLYLSLGLGVLF